MPRTRVKPLVFDNVKILMTFESIISKERIRKNKEQGVEQTVGVE